MAYDDATKKNFKDTLNLPRTDFPIRANAQKEDPEMIKRWQEENLAARTFTLHQGKTVFLLHDGPPYANGNIHLGHAYNKVLKDIIAKSERMTGKQVPITPGWDCHGLPIELKVSKENPGIDAQGLRKKCRESAAHWIVVQKEQFKKLGILMDWDNPYITMDPKQEADTVRAFADCVERGYVSRKNKTVPWCASCQTVLATAEIEYQERKDPSIYVGFRLDQAVTKKAFNLDVPVDLLMWTTTPWTVPLNRALFLKPATEYVVIKVNDKYAVVGAALVDKLCAIFGVEKEIFATCKAEDLVGAYAEHPFITGQKTPIFADTFVGLEDGTAVVHSAPGCGPEDYEMGIKYGIEIFSPLSADGKYTYGIKPQVLEGMATTDALGWVIKTLQDADKLYFKTSIKHNYPHCWRCRNGLMFRATKQWFCELQHDTLRERALDAVQNDIAFLPPATRNHLKSTLANRYEWCVSRQRVWGTPIVALLCTKCDKEYVAPELMRIVAEGIEKEGVEYWARVSVAELLPVGLACTCASAAFKKETDILDVWFDSGVTHTTVLKARDQKYPADMYLEGIDQHRGWFQSSLLTSLMLSKEPAMKTIVTHGFTVDDKGRKMSKSLGNVVSPDDLVAKIGTDGLRLWVSAIDIEGDAVVSETLLENVAQVHRKIRNTARFLLSNLYDFDKDYDVLPIDQLLAIDAYGLFELTVFDKKIRDAYAKKDITAVYHALTDYCFTHLSSLYLDVIKDRLYTDQADGRERRSAQTVCWYILDTLTKLIAPILSFTAEQVSDYYQKNKKDSIHTQLFADVSGLLSDIQTKNYQEKWKVMHAVRQSVLRVLEGLRKQGLIKHSLEAKVTIVMKNTKEMRLLKELFDEVEKTGQSRHSFLKELLIVSACDIIEEEFEDDSEQYDEETGELIDCSQDVPGLLVQACQAPGAKCPRCWQWEQTNDKDGLCARCQKVIARTIN